MGRWKRSRQTSASVSGSLCHGSIDNKSVGCYLVVFLCSLRIFCKKKRKRREVLEKPREMSTSKFGSFRCLGSPLRYCVMFLSRGISFETSILSISEDRNLACSIPEAQVMRRSSRCKHALPVRITGARIPAENSQRPRKQAAPLISF